MMTNQLTNKQLIKTMASENTVKHTTHHTQLNISLQQVNVQSNQTGLGRLQGKRFAV